MSFPPIELSAVATLTSIRRFLLARLQLESLKQAPTPADLHEALTNLPTGQQALHHSYAQAVQRIEAQAPALALLGNRVLGWLSCTHRPLHVLELQHALAVNLEPGTDTLDVENILDIDTIVSSCAGLVTADSESTVVRLVHYTTQEYLESFGETWLKNAQADIILTCLNYCSFAEFVSGPVLPRTETPADKAVARTALYKRIETYPFLPYAASVLDKHPWEGHDNRIRDAATGLLEDDAKFGNFWQAMNLRTHFITSGQIKLEDFIHTFNARDYIKGIHYVAMSGEKSLLERLFSRGCHGNTADGDGRTPLSHASANGHDAIVCMLLQRHDVDPDSADNTGRAALCWAAEYGQDKIVKSLLETGKVNPDLRTYSGATPLSYAASQGHLAVVELLLNYRPRIDVNPRGMANMTPLHYSIVRGHTAITRRLLEEPTIDPGIINGQNTTALSMAAGSGCVESLQLLLKHRPPIDVSGDVGTKALSAAAHRCHIEALELLMRRGIHPNVGLSGDAPGLALRTVAGSHSAQAAAAANMLLAYGAFVDAADDAGRTPLSSAASQGTTSTIKVLLENGAVLDQADESGRTPLSWAAQRRDPRAALCLLEMGADTKGDIVELLQKRIQHVREFGKKHYIEQEIEAAEKIRAILIRRGHASGC